jgi:hypothetical protein
MVTLRMVVVGARDTTTPPLLPAAVVFLVARESLIVIRGVPYFKARDEGAPRGSRGDDGEA